MRTIMSDKIIIEIKGLASRKLLKRVIVEAKNIPDISLMDFLIQEGLTIASSCGGEGRCGKCVVNNSLISCQINLQDFIKNQAPVIEISYL